jgi:PAS domain S-box-containing protein
MSRSNPLRIASRPGLFLSLTRLDWFALYLATASVLLFALSMLMSSPQGGSVLTDLQQLSWLNAGSRQIALNRVLLIFLAVELLLLLWLWLEFPRRRRAESALRKIHSLQRAIARSSARIVTMQPEQIGMGLHNELSGIREMLGVDRICWYQQAPDGKRFVRLQSASALPDLPNFESFATTAYPWISEAILRGVPIHLRSLREMPAGTDTDRCNLEPSGLKSLAVVSSNSGGGPANTLMLASFTREIDWDEGVVAQLSVLASVFANAHARKLAQEAGSESESRFRHLFEEAPIGCCLADSRGRIAVSNVALARMLGYSSEELVGKGFWEITATDDLAKSMVHFQELVSGVRDFYQQEKRYVKRDGTVIWGRLTVSLLGARSPEGQFVLAMIEDVTDAVRAREQLEHSRRSLTMALEASRMTAWEYEPATGMISWVDRTRLRRPSAGSEGPVQFADVLQHVHPDDRTMLLELADRLVNEGGAFSAEFRMFARDGSIRWMLGKGELLLKEGESGAKIAGVTLDVSELKRTQLELQELAKRLMEAQEEERRRISRELHDDIGQRVSLLAIELDLVRQLLEGQEHLRDRVERAQAATGELGTDLHQLSHALHSSKLQYLGLPAALRELCTRIAERHSLTVQLDCEEHRLALPEEDALALFRVAQEALNNVVRHSRASKVKVALTQVPNEVRLMVCDNGTGFDPARKTSGIGVIGMRERLRAIGGEFQIISAPQGGTEVHAKVTMPLPAQRRAGVQMRAGTLQ